MRSKPRLLLGFVLAAATLGACQPNAPVAEEKPSRKLKSFEDSSSAAPASDSGSTEAQAQQVRDTWDKAREAKDDADRQRLANEALQQTREMAEPSSAPQSP